MAKFNKGEKVRVVAEFCGHNFKIGEVVTIDRVGTNDYYAVNKDGRGWFVTNGEIAPFNGKYFNEGDKAITNGLNVCGHGFAKGTVVTVKKAVQGEVDYVEDANGRGFWVDNDELDTYKAPTPTRFKLDDVIYLEHIEVFIHLEKQSTLDLANGSTGGIRIATEDERRKHLGLPPVKRDTDVININIAVTRKALREAVEVLGKANTGYEVYTKLDDINDKENR
jgi:hypothetical protein